MGLLDKKYCDVCGERIRFLGNKKLEDGNLCKDCESKLSEWFSDRRRSTVEEIKAQLRDREANQARVEAFSTSRTLGEGNQLLLDDANQRFLVLRSGRTLRDNPDVLDLSQITGCEVKTEHTKTEEKTKDAEGKFVSFNPPRFKYSYRFFLHIYVNHPWFDEISFQINRSPVVIETGLPVQFGRLASLNRFTPDVPDTEHCAEYQRYQALGAEMQNALLGTEEEPAPPPQAEAAAPAVQEPVKVACPACTAVSYPDSNGCCPYCGEKLI